MVPLLKVICALGLVVLATSLTEEDFAFNCHRDGANQCMNTATCNDKGKCVCPGTEKGYDCSVAIEATDCDASCATTVGACSTDQTCLCKPMLYGPKCEMKAHEVSCADPTQLLPKIQIPGIDKALKIYIEDQPACTQNSTEMAATITGFNGVVTKIVTDETKPCHTTAMKIDVGGTQTDATCVTMVIQFNKYVTYYDYKVQFCCLSFGDPSGNGVKIIVGQIQPPKATLQSPNPVQGDPMPGVTSELISGAGAVIEKDAVMNVGDVVILRFQLPQDDPRRIKIMQCELSDTVNEESKTVFFDNGCMVKSIATKMDVGINTGRAFSTVTTRAVKFQDQPIVQYICLVRVCKVANLAMCSKTACGARRRRDVAQASSNTNNGTLEGEVWQFVRVASPRGLTKTTTQSTNCEMEDNKMTFTATVIGFGLITVVLLVIVAVLGFCILNRRRRSSNCKE